MDPMLQELVNEANAKAAAGQTFDVTGPDQAQCTAVPHRLEQLLGDPIVYGDAKDMYANADPNLYLKGTSRNPPVGSTISYDASWGGGHGHTGVVMPGTTDTQLVILEQNDGDNGLPHVGTHNYNGYIGYALPRAFNQGEFMSTVTTEIGRIIYYAIWGVNGQHGQPNALDGSIDNQIQAYVGKDTNDIINLFWNAPEGDAYRKLAASQGGGGTVLSPGTYIVK